MLVKIDRIFINNPYKFVKKHPKSKLRYALIPSGWIFQGLLYADKTEKAFKILIDFILMLIFYLIFINFINILESLIYAFILAHTFNWFFNSNLMIVFTKKYGLSIRAFVISFQISYIEELQNRIKKENSIQCAAIYGSLSRNENCETSDLDVRIIRKPGVINGIRACSFCMFERTRAVFNKFPLDLFLLDSMKPLSKLRDDEVPVVLHDPDRKLEKKYPQVTFFT